MNQNRHHFYRNPRNQFHSRKPSASQLLQLIQNPGMRWHEVAGGMALLNNLLVEDDPDLRELLYLKIREQLFKKELSEDPFYDNIPLADIVLNGNRSSQIHLTALPDRRWLSFPIQGVCRNVLVCGPAGGGKTTWMRGAIIDIARAGGTVIAFDLKGRNELVPFQQLIQNEIPLLPLRWEELKISLLQPIHGLPLDYFLNVFVEMMASILSLEASRRLLMETLHSLNFSPEKFPTLKEWIEKIESVKPASFRAEQYREASLYALKTLEHVLGRILNYRSSDMIQKMLSFQGVVSIQMNGLTKEGFLLIANIIILWAYELRRIQQTTS